jgi:hypothetical protein
LATCLLLLLTFLSGMARIHPMKVNDNQKHLTMFERASPYTRKSRGEHGAPLYLYHRHVLPFFFIFFVLSHTPRKMFMLGMFRMGRELRWRTFASKLCCRDGGAFAQRIPNFSVIGG